MGYDWSNGIPYSLKAALAGVSGFLIAGLGGWTWPLRALITLVILDYVSGVMQAALEKRLNSRVGFRGIAKKVYYFLLIAAVYVCETALIPDPQGYVTMALTSFFAINEFISIAEHGRALGIVLPEAVRDVFERLRRNLNGGADSEQWSSGDMGEA